MARRQRIGELLVAAKRIDELQLRAALADQQRFGARLGTTLVKLGFLSEEELVTALASQLDMPIARLAGKRIAPDVLEILPAVLAEKYGCIPLFTKRESGVAVVYLGMEDPTDLHALDDLTFRTGMKLRPVLVAPSELQAAIRTHYRDADRREPDDSYGFEETPLDPSDTAPLLPGRERPTAVDAPAAAAAPAEAATRPRVVATRTILRAITQLLIEKDVLGREELVARIESLTRAGSEDG